MKVILLENLVKIGSIGDVIDVKRGFARNYLIASKKALYASKENIKEVDKIKKDLNKKDLEKNSILLDPIHDFLDLRSDHDPLGENGSTIRSRSSKKRI